MKKVVWLHIVFLFLMFIGVTHAAEVRTWTSKSGKFTVEAKLSSISDDEKSVTLLKTNGKEIKVAIKQLSRVDQAYVRTRQNAAKAEQERKEREDAVKAEQERKEWVEIAEPGEKNREIPDAFTGIRCEYIQSFSRNEGKGAFAIMGIEANSPAEKALGSAQRDKNVYLSSIPSGYTHAFIPHRGDAKQEDVVDGLYAPRTPVSAIEILSTFNDSVVHGRIIEITCVSKKDWEQIHGKLQTAAQWKADINRARMAIVEKENAEWVKMEQEMRAKQRPYDDTYTPKVGVRVERRLGGWNRLPQWALVDKRTVEAVEEDSARTLISGMDADGSPQTVARKHTYETYEWLDNGGNIVTVYVVDDVVVKRHTCKYEK